MAKRTKPEAEPVTDDEAQWDEPTGLQEDEEYESTVRPPEPYDEHGKLAEFSLMRIQETERQFRWGFGKNSNIYFMVQFEIQGGEYDLRRIGGLLGTTPSTFRKATAADDFLHACGSDLRPHTNRGYREAIEATFGPFDVTLDWELYCPNEPKPNNPDKTGVTVIRGYNKFPIMEDGHTRKHEVECPECGEFLTAKAVIRRFIIPRD